MVWNKWLLWKSRVGLQSPPSSGVRDAIQWLAMARLSVLFVILSVALLQYIFQGVGGSQSAIVGFSILSVAFAFNFLQSLFLYQLPEKWVVIVGNILFDGLLISAWLLLSGAQDSRLIALFFLVQILLVSLVFFRRGALMSAGTAIVLFGCVCAMQKLPSGWAVWGIYSLLFAVLGWVGGYLSESLMKTTRTLREQSRRHEGLREFHEKVILNMPTGLIAVDAEMKVNFINPAGENILSKQSREVMGRHLSEVEEDLLPFFTKIEMEDIEDEPFDSEYEPDKETALSATGTHLRRSFFAHPRSSGKIRLQQTVEVGTGAQAKIIRGDVAELEAGGVKPDSFGKGGVLLFQDVTKLQHLEEKVHQNEKLAAVGQLAAGIAHEIRNPLAGISASIEMLKGAKGDGVEGEDQRLMEIALKEIDRLNELINEFLDFVKPFQFKFESVSLKQVLGEVLENVRSTHQVLSRKIRIEEDFDESAKAHANASKLKQVILNLVINATQAVEEGGRILVSCKRLNPHLVRFSVVDDGGGMSEKVLAHLFEPFFTTKEKGTGLGLATAYKIIEAHHGEIRVESKENVGTTFEVFLPGA